MASRPSAKREEAFQTWKLAAVFYPCKGISAFMFTREGMQSRQNPVRVDFEHIPKAVAARGRGRARPNSSWGVLKWVFDGKAYRTGIDQTAKQSELDGALPAFRPPPSDSAMRGLF